MKREVVDEERGDVRLADMEITGEEEDDVLRPLTILTRLLESCLAT